MSEPVSSTFGVQATNMAEAVAWKDTPYTRDQLFAVLGMLLISLQFWAYRAIYTMGGRKKHMDGNAMKKFKDTHSEAFPGE